MKNITVTVSDELYRRARVKAAENDTTVTAVVRDVLEKYASGETSTLVEAIDKVRADMAAQGRYFSASERLSREELYEEAFRGHERSPLQRK